MQVRAVQERQYYEDQAAALRSLGEGGSSAMPIVPISGVRDRIARSQTLPGAAEGA